MAQVPDSGFATKSLCLIGRCLALLGLTGALAAASLAHAQATSSPTGSSIRKDKPHTSAVSPSTPAPVVPSSVAPIAAVAPPPAPPTAEQTPPQPPTVTWDGNLLTIDADNSTLTDILVTVRTQTGASIQIPSAASTERVFVHLGPGPIRDIISSLLYGTGFDYIVEASEDDPDTLRSVVVTARGKGDDSTDGSIANTSDTALARGSTSHGIAPREGMRMMRGWAGPSTPAFQAEAEAALAAEEAARESTSASDAADANAQGQQAAPHTDSASAGQEASAAASPADASAVTETDLPPAAEQAASSSPSGSDPSDQTQQKIQNMMRMFEQRRQIQAKQNQAAHQQSEN